VYRYVAAAAGHQLGERLLYSSCWHTRQQALDQALHWWLACGAFHHYFGENIRRKQKLADDSLPGGFTDTNQRKRD
jgi:hypothetical protein